MHRFERWRSLITVAPNKARVQAVIREYVEGVMPSDLAKLPSTSQAMLAVPDADIPGTAVTLLQDELRVPAETEAGVVLHELAEAFSAASTRLAQIESHATMVIPPLTGPGGREG